MRWRPVNSDGVCGRKISVMKRIWKGVLCGGSVLLGPRNPIGLTVFELYGINISMQ